MMKRLAVALLLLVMSFTAVPVIATAASSGAFSNTAVKCSGEASGSAVCESKVTGTENPVAGNTGIIAKITDVLAWVSGVAAVIVLIVSGIRYITSDGEAGKVASAKSTALYALLGLVVIVVARGLVNYVVLRL